MGAVEHEVNKRHKHITVFTLTTWIKSSATGSLFTVALWSVVGYAGAARQLITKLYYCISAYKL